jgi:hypothetical protein
MECRAEYQQRAAQHTELARRAKQVSSQWRYVC